MTTGHNINASRPYGHSNKMARETSAELADISCCGQRRDFLGGLGNCNDERLRVRRQEACGDQGSTRRTSASIPDLVACASTYFRMLSRRAWLSTWSGSEHQSSEFYASCQAVEVNCAGGCAHAGTVQSTHKLCAPSTTQTLSAVRSSRSRLRS